MHRATRLMRQAGEAFARFDRAAGAALANKAVLVARADNQPRLERRARSLLAAERVGRFREHPTGQPLAFHDEPTLGRRVWVALKRVLFKRHGAGA